MQVRKNRCQLRHQNIELQAIKDLLRVLKADMHSIHLRTSRLEAAAAEFEEAESFFPLHEARAHQLRAKVIFPKRSCAISLYSTFMSELTLETCLPSCTSL